MKALLLLKGIDIHFKSASDTVLYMTKYHDKRSIHHRYYLNYSEPIGLAHVIKTHKFFFKFYLLFNS